VVDSNARILKANNIVLSRVGYSREDLLHKNIVFIHAPERERELAYIFEDIRPGLTDTCHIPFVTRNGACIEVETRISRGFWDGAPVFLCISRDISLNKRQEEKIKAINESYERLTTYAGEAIFHILPDGQQVVYVNHAAEQLVGYKLAEWLSNPNLLWSLLHPDSLKDKVCIMERIKNGEDVIKGLSLKWVARDGREVITDITILAVRNEYGQIVYYESIARNITEQKRAEQALKLSEARYRMVVEDQSD
jgi:PAS domain S-box-containing protein